MTTCFVIVSGGIDDTFDDLVRSIRKFCDGADIAWYNSGRRRDTPFDIHRVVPDRPLKYRKVTPAFFDIFEWAAERNYDYIVNVETDLAFIRPGFLEFLGSQLRDVDYMAQGLRYRIPPISLWPAYSSLAGERKELTEILGVTHLNRCFSPGQVFGRGFVSALLSSARYPAVRAFVERNQQPENSWTLQELILPSLVDSIGAQSRSYPEGMARFNRFRPYQSVSDLRIARSARDAFFLHPIRRDRGDAVRAYVKDLVRDSARVP